MSIHCRPDSLLAIHNDLFHRVVMQDPERFRHYERSSSDDRAMVDWHLDVTLGNGVHLFGRQNLERYLPTPEMDDREKLKAYFRNQPCTIAVGFNAVTPQYAKRLQSMLETLLDRVEETEKDSRAFVGCLLTRNHPYARDGKYDLTLLMTMNLYCLLDEQVRQVDISSAQKMRLFNQMIQLQPVLER